MTGYFSRFCILGEVADMLLLDKSQKRLLVDVSTDPPGHEEAAFRRYPNRLTLTVEGEEAIERFLQSFAIGDVAEIEGGITQSEYVPHKTTCIDTIMLVSSFRKPGKSRPIAAGSREIRVQKGSALYH